MTLEESLAKVAELTAENKELLTKNIELTAETDRNIKQLDKVTNEAAENRIHKQSERKRAYVMKEVLKRNNIEFDVNSHSLEGLTIVDGEVTGDVTYDPKRKTEVGAGVSPASNGTAGVMSIESIQGMSREEIADNWAAVEKTLSDQSR